MALQLVRFGIDYEVVVGVDGNALSDDEIGKSYNALAFSRRNGRQATRGEIGCALGHQKAYRRIAEENLSHALILEDDAWLNPNLPAAMEELERTIPPDEPVVVLLTWAIQTPTGRSKPLSMSYRIADAPKASCAHGYVITQAAATNLARELYPVSHVADAWGWMRKHGYVRVCNVYPPLITNDLSQETQVAPQLAGRKNRPFIHLLRRRAGRAYWFILDEIGAIVTRLTSVLKK